MTLYEMKKEGKKKKRDKEKKIVLAQKIGTCEKRNSKKNSLNELPFYSLVVCTH